MLAARDAVDPVQRATANNTILDRVSALPAFVSARTVMAYAGFGSELDTAPLLAATLATGKTLILPRVDRAKRALRLFVVRDLVADLVAGVWGIREPTPARCAPADPDAVDFVLVPGVAFTPAGDRLGYGGGYYDGWIAALRRRPALIAAGYAMQVLPALPTDASDQRVDGVLTELARYGVAYE